jgi:hypothetical protein
MNAGGIPAKKEGKYPCNDSEPCHCNAIEQACACWTWRRGIDLLRALSSKLKRYVRLLLILDTSEGTTFQAYHLLIDNSSLFIN